MLHPIKSKSHPTDDKRIEKLNKILEDLLDPKKGNRFWSGRYPYLFPIKKKDEENFHKGKKEITEINEISSCYKSIKIEKVGENLHFHIKYMDSDRWECDGSLEEFYSKLDDSSHVGTEAASADREKELKALLDVISDKLFDLEIKEYQKENHPQFVKAYRGVAIGIGLLIVGAAALLPIFVGLALLSVPIIAAVVYFVPVKGPSIIFSLIDSEMSAFRKIYSIKKDESYKAELSSKLLNSLESRPDAGASSTLDGQHGSRPDVNLSNLRRFKSLGDIPSQEFVSSPNEKKKY